MNPNELEFEMRKADILELQTKLRILQEIHSIISELLDKTYPKILTSCNQTVTEKKQ
jgi:hypothetical protein